MAVWHAAALQAGRERGSQRAQRGCGPAEQVSFVGQTQRSARSYQPGPGPQRTSASSATTWAEVCPSPRPPAAHQACLRAGCEQPLAGLCAEVQPSCPGPLPRSLRASRQVTPPRSPCLRQELDKRDWNSSPRQSTNGRCACGLPPVLPSLCVSFREEHFWSSLAATQHNCFAHQ